MHLAIIMDGNRRFAKKSGLKPRKGHVFGTETAEKLLDWCRELEIKELTLYALSIENLQRDKIEVSYLMDLARKWFLNLKNDARLERDKIKIKFIGKLELLPKDIRELFSEIEKKTGKNNNFKLNFCLAYGGRQEIVHAVNKLKENNEQVSEENIKKNLWLISEPDIIIRTGSQIRTSNFLPWQSIYSEWFFLDKLWPEFEKQDLIHVLEQFNNRKRNFGK